MILRLVLPTLLGALVLSPLQGLAQGGGKVSLQFLSFPKSLDPDPVELLVGDGKTIEVEIPSSELSQPYKVNAQKVWAVGESTIDEDGKPTFKVWGKAPALGAGKPLIILVRKGKSYDDGFELIPVDGLANRFGGGSFLFMNAARVDVAGEVGGEKFALHPGERTIIKPAPLPGRDNITHATLYYRKGEKPRPFFSSRWPLHANARSLIFLYHDPKTDRIRLHSIRDFF